MKQALGLVEAAGLVGAITVADAMAKAANVTILGMERARGFGWTTVKVSGDVAAVQAAVQTGSAILKTMGLYVGQKVIPRPADCVLEAFHNEYEVAIETVADTATDVTPTAPPKVETQPSAEAEVKAAPAAKVEEKVALKAASKLVEPVKTQAPTENPVKTITDIIEGKDHKETPKADTTAATTTAPKETSVKPSSTRKASSARRTTTRKPANRSSKTTKKE